MPSFARTVSLSAAALVAVALLSPATASAERDDVFGRMPLHVTAGCSVPMAPALPATPSLPAGCAGPAPSEASPAVGAAAAADDECLAVVPLVDDRCEAWTARYDGPAGGTDYPTSDLGGSRLLAVSPDSATVFAAGTSDSNPSPAADGIDMDLVVVGTDAATGAPNWTFRLPHPDQSYAQHVVADPDGDLVYATSNDYPAGGNCVRRPTTVAVDQVTGGHAWTARESTPEGGCVDVQSTAVDPAGERLFVVASSQGANGHSEQTLIARDADTGELLWSRSAAAPAPLLGATGSAVAVSADGSRVYAGGSFLAEPLGSLTHVAWLVQGYDAATGSRVLDVTWNVPQAQYPNTANPPAAMAVSPDGSSLYVVGGAEHVFPSRLMDITALSFDTGSGALRWLYRYDGPKQKSSFDSVWFNGPLALSADGTRIAIAGYSSHLIGVNLQLDVATMLLDTADGRELWVTRYTSESESNWMPSVALSPDATKVYVAAMSRYAAKWEAPSRFTTLSYQASTGAVAWTARHSNGHSFTQGSALTPDGSRFVVTGMTADAGPQTATGVNWGLGLAAYSTP